MSLVISRHVRPFTGVYNETIPAMGTMFDAALLAGTIYPLAIGKSVFFVAVSARIAFTSAAEFELLVTF